MNKSIANAKPTTPLGRWVFGPLMLSFALCATHSVAQAQSQLSGSEEPEGHWTVSSKWTGGSNSGTVGYGVGIDNEIVTESYRWDYKTQDFTGQAPTANAEALITSQIVFGPGTISGDQALYAQAHSTSHGTTAKAQASGTAEFTFNWVPTVAGGKPSKDLHVFITSQASADVFSMSGGNGQPITGKVWASAEGKPKDDPQDQPVVTYPSKTANGIKLFTISKDELSSTISVSLEAGAETPGFSGGQRIDAMAYLEASTQFDDRSLALSRSGARDERQALENGEWHGYSDSIYSARSPDVENGVSEYHPLSIGVNYPGNWSRWGTGYNVNPSWTTSGFEPFGLLDGTNNLSAWGKTKFGTPMRAVDNFHGFPYYNGLEGDPTGAETFDTTYTAVDNGDGATAKAYYHLTLHDPVELLDEGQTITTYEVRSPMRIGGQIAAWSGFRAANVAEQTVKIVKSVETGLDLSATTDVSLFKGLLGFSAEANLTSTKEVSVDTEIKVPAISQDMMRYLIETHKFQRKHVRFDKYDEGGKIHRMVTTNILGVVFDPPVDMYHEAIRDNAFQTNPPEWSSEVADNTDLESLPHDPIPPLDYDFSGGVS